MEDKKEANWYYEKDGKQVGPVSADAIQVLVEANRLSYGDMVWQKGSPEWEKLEYSGFKNLLANKPPPLNIRESNMKSDVKRRVGKIILFIIIVGLLFNFAKACKLAIGSSDTKIAILTGKAYACDVTTADRFNVGMGYFFTFGIGKNK